MKRGLVSTFYMRWQQTQRFIGREQKRFVIGCCLVVVQNIRRVGILGDTANSVLICLIATSKGVRPNVYRLLGWFSIGLFLNAFDWLITIKKPS